jgi:hypothetical protein
MISLDLPHQILTGAYHTSIIESITEASILCRSDFCYLYDVMTLMFEILRDNSLTSVQIARFYDTLISIRIASSRERGTTVEGSLLVRDTLTEGDITLSHGRLEYDRIAALRSDSDIIDTVTVGKSLRGESLLIGFSIVST